MRMRKEIKKQKVLHLPLVEGLCILDLQRNHHGVVVHPSASDIGSLRTLQCVQSKELAMVKLKSPLTIGQFQERWQMSSYIGYHMIYVVVRAVLANRANGIVLRI